MSEDKTITALIFTFAHLPQELMFLSSPPLDITTNKYSDKKYLARCAEMIAELKDEAFCTRSDGVSPYSKDIILKHIKNRLAVL